MGARVTNMADPMDAESQNSSGSEEESDEEEGYPPNNTIRVNNLNEKVKGVKLRKAINAVFKQFGDILEIVAMDSLKFVRSRGRLSHSSAFARNRRRGQAF